MIPSYHNISSSVIRMVLVQNMSCLSFVSEALAGFSFDCAHLVANAGLRTLYPSCWCNGSNDRTYSTELSGFPRNEGVLKLLKSWATMTLHLLCVSDLMWSLIYVYKTFLLCSGTCSFNPLRQVLLWRWLHYVLFHTLWKHWER